MKKKYSPRIWIHELDRKGVASTHALIHFQPDHEHKEYLSKEEFDAIVQPLVEALEFAENLHDECCPKRWLENCKCENREIKKALENYKKQTGEGK